MSEAFEKAWSNYLEGFQPKYRTVVNEQGKHHATPMWDACKAHMQEPQTVETCKANPPHPKTYLVVAPVIEINGYLEKPSYKPYCLVCEAKSAGRREGLTAVRESAQGSLAAYSTNLFAALSGDDHKLLNDALDKVGLSRDRVSADMGRLIAASVIADIDRLLEGAK